MTLPLIPNNFAPSLLVNSQLPGFIRDDNSYQKFVTFINAYYQWLETQGGPIQGAKSLLQYDDIDQTQQSVQNFIQYFINDYLANFPSDVVTDKSRLIKYAKTLYANKGTPDSFKFFFRALYNSDCQIFLNNDLVLRPSDGVWYIPRAIRVKSLDASWLNSRGYRILGTISKTIAAIERGVLDPLGKTTDIYLSDIQRTFQTGEFVQIVDAKNQPVWFLNGTVVAANTPGANTISSKIVGSISSININPNYRGSTYNVGDPVVIYGGLDNTSNIGGASAVIGAVTSGSVTGINLPKDSFGNMLQYAGGFGYIQNPGGSLPDAVVNPALSEVVISSPTGAGALAIIQTTGPYDPANQANVNLVVTNAISNRMFGVAIGNSVFSFFAANPTANANTRLSAAFSFITLNTAPISSIIVVNGGGGYTSVPTVTTETLIATDVSNPADTGNGYGSLWSLGILDPIQIINGGNGYSVNDTIVITGGSGTGANAKIVSVNGTGGITQVGWNTANTPPGGFGYNNGLPTISVSSANGSNAVLSIPGILAAPIQTNISTNRIGAITSFNILDFGEDYNATPNVSLNIQTLPVKGLNINNLPQKGQTIFQGANVNVASYTAFVAGIPVLVTPDANTANSLYNLMVYNPNSIPVANLTLNINTGLANLSFNLANSVIKYGDGTALANAAFYNGLIIGQGSYIGAKGQPSSYTVLQSDNYNAFTYTITVQKEIQKYGNALLNLLHPAGTKVIGRTAIKSLEHFNTNLVEANKSGNTINFAVATMYVSNPWVTHSNNIINLSIDPTLIAQVNNLIFLNTFPPGPSIGSKIIAISNTTTGNANTITLAANTWLTWGNVAYVSANANSNAINILALNTLGFNYTNGGVYSNTQFPLMDIVFANDNLLLSGIQNSVTKVDYINGIIYLANNVTSNIANSLISINRSVSTSNITVGGAIGIQYFAQLATESGNTIVTDTTGFIITT